MVFQTWFWVWATNTQSGDADIGADNADRWACGKGIAEYHPAFGVAPAPIAGKGDALGNLKDKPFDINPHGAVDLCVAGYIDHIARFGIF